MSEPRPNADALLRLEHVMALLAERDRQYAQRFDAQEKAVVAAMAAAEKAIVAAMAAAEKAVAKAEVAAEKRFEGVNEFRGQLTDQAATFISRVEYDASRKGLTEKIDDMRARLDASQGRSTGVGAAWAVLLGAVTLIAAVVGVILAVSRR